MNRNERRKLKRTIPEYKKTLKTMTKKAVDDLEIMFKRKWEENDETLNEGDISYNDDDGEDDVYND